MIRKLLATCLFVGIGLIVTGCGSDDSELTKVDATKASINNNSPEAKNAPAAPPPNPEFPTP